MGVWGKRVFWILAGAVLIFMAGSRILEVSQQKSQLAGKKKTGGARTVSVGLASAARGLLREELLLTGSLKPKKQVAVTSKATGRVERILFQVGDNVRSGAMIAELDDDELRQQVNRAEASLRVAAASVTQREAERANAGAELDRAKNLFDNGLLSPQDYESRKTNVVVVRAQVELAEAQKGQAEAELKELKIRLDQVKVYSPMNGVVAVRHVDEGALVSPATPILTIVDLSTMVTRGNVPERSIGKLRVGNQAIVHVDAIPGEPYRGRVARIAPVLDVATRSALIEIDIPNPRQELKAEMFVRIELDLGTSREATLIPREGLVYRGEQAGVYLVRDGRPVFHSIETGLTRGDSVEVLANLEPGTEIIGRGASMLRDGDRIRIAGRDKAGKTASGQGRTGRKGSAEGPGESVSRAASATAP